MIFFKEKYVDLPTSKDELSSFIKLIVTKYSLPDTDQSAGMICQEIMHMGRTVSKAPLSVFASAIKKQLSNDVVYPKIEELRHKMQEAAKQVESAPAKVDSDEQQLVQDATVQSSIS